MCCQPRWFLLVFILLLSLVLRIFKLDLVPPSVTWDEAAVGYNAFSIANYGKDEYGTLLPLYFRSFGEDKQPVHIYITALFIKVLGLSEFSTRLPSAVFGTLNVLLIFYLVKLMFDKELIAFLSAFFLAISPQNIFFSRFNHEANFALFFFMLGLVLFFTAIKKRRDFLPLSMISFFASTISYHAAEIVVPIVSFLLFILYFREISRNKISLFIIAFLVGGFILLVFFQPRLFGVARYNQTVQGQRDFENTSIYKKTNNLLLGRLELILNQYSWHFTPKYLFISGDKNPRLSSQGTGEFYYIDAVFLILGVAYLLFKRSKISILILSWAIIGPLPSSLFGEAPHAGRAAFMMGGWNIVSALGVYSVLILIRKKVFKGLVLGAVLAIYLFSLSTFLVFYFYKFPKQFAIDWQYGMKQTVGFVKDHPEYSQVFVTDVRAQPYIFFLYYLKTPLPDYLNSAILNNSKVSDYNNISMFDKYSFGNWDVVQSFPAKGVLYILTPSEYDGLWYKKDFDIKKEVLYPNKTVAFYIIGAK